MRAEELLRIGRLFDQLKWSIPLDFKSTVPDVFDRFVRMCCRLSPSQRELILELTAQYVWIPPREYEDRLLATWQLMVRQLPSHIQTVVVCPLAKPNATRPRSSDRVHKEVEAFQRNFILTLAPRALEVWKFEAKFAAKFGGNSAAALVLVDDYVGTGDTVIKAIGRLHRKFPSTKDNLVILLTFVAQRAAVTRIQGATSCQVVAGQTLGKGISDHGSLPNIAASLATMKELGHWLALADDTVLGYGETEGLVTMMRTPNNTFPVFWTNKKVKGAVWDSPFTRYTTRGN